MISIRSRPVVFLFVLSLLAGCRSEQVAFNFSAPVGAGPGAPRRVASPAAADARPAPLAPAVSAVAPARLLENAAPAETRRLRARRPAALRAVQRTAVKLALAGPLRPRHRAGSAIARTQRTAEAGLGRTVLFILGVVLAVLAGLAALVNVIFGVGFFTALGYTAAGLLVLYLLYQLFSPKKKA